VAEYKASATGWSFLLRVVYVHVGLDLGFYLFHRACHVNKFLYKQVHRDLHIDTASKHGRLVAFETYTITWAETTRIAVSYVIGVGLVMLLKGSLDVAPLSSFEFATLMSWGHNVELLGHTATTSTPRFHPMRVAPPPPPQEAERVARKYGPTLTLIQTLTLGAEMVARKYGPTPTLTLTLGAEMVARKYGLGRGKCDAFAARSHARAAAAQAEGRFDKEVVALVGRDKVRGRHCRREIV